MGRGHVKARQFNMNWGFKLACRQNLNQIVKFVLTECA